MAALNVNGLDHVVLRVGDITRSIAWYKSVLGCTEERRLRDLGLYQMRLGAALIDLVPVQGKLGKPGGAAPGKTRRNVDHIAVQLEAFDERKIRAHLRRRGVEPGEVARRYGALGHGPSMYITDPDGNTVELKGPPDPDQTELVGGAEYPSRGRKR
jgi:catechol 2,3-dioxygenase-like lactoylglutathione lyase family enzyme